MSLITITEAKALASYLSNSYSLVSDPHKRSVWLNHLARGCGYRDWNAMSKAAPEAPDIQWGDWGSLYLGMAEVQVEGQPPSFHLAAIRDKGTARQGFPEILALSIQSRWGDALHGRTFAYSRPDGYAPDPMNELNIIEPMMMTMGELQAATKTPKWLAHPPVVARSSSGARIIVWWLDTRYTIVRQFPENELRFSVEAISQNLSGYDGEPLTDQLLHRLTGIARTRRKCLYVPLAPRPNFAPATGESYWVITVEEGRTIEIEPSIDLGPNRDAAVEKVMAMNRVNGISSFDADDITQRYQTYEPRPDEEDVFEGWLSED